MHQKSRLLRTLHIGLNLCDGGPLFDVVQDFLGTAFDARDDQAAARFLHRLHGVIVKVHSGVTQPFETLVQSFFFEQAADFQHPLLSCGKGIVLNHDLFNIWEMFCDIFKFSHHIFRASQSVCMAVHGLRIDAEVASCHAAASGEDLNFRIGRRCKEIIFVV